MITIDLTDNRLPDVSHATEKARAALVTFDQVYALLKRFYKHERFEGRNGSVFGSNFSWLVATSAHEQLQDHGYLMIAGHESVTGSPLIFDSSLALRDSVWFKALVRSEIRRD